MSASAAKSEVADRILIRGLRVSSRIGVPDDERAAPQALVVHAEIAPEVAFRDAADDITRTVDYHAVCLALESLAASGERRLIETLAVEMAELVLRDFPARSVTLEIQKFILPQTDHVGVVCTLTK